MAPQNGKSPEYWEAQDHIDSLKNLIPELSGNASVSAEVAVLARALVWIVRHVDLEEKKNGNTTQTQVKQGGKIQLGPLRIEGFAARHVAMLVVILAMIYTILVTHGVLPSFKEERPAPQPTPIVNVLKR